MTLLELLVVVVLLGLLAAVGAQVMPGNGRKVDAAAGRAEHLLRKARLQAMRTGQPVFVACGQLAAGRASAQARGSGNPPVSAACSGSAGPAGGVAFFPDGSSSGETVELAAGTVRARLRIDWLTGATSVE